MTMSIGPEEARFFNDLNSILSMGWIENTRVGNHGSVGNMLEDILGIPENNLPLPDISRWELKSNKTNSNALTTLFHTEPYPRSARFVPQILLPKYGWRHSEAGRKYSETEMSFRQTINSVSRSDRGFKVDIDRTNEKVLISFDSNYIDKERHQDWYDFVKHGVGLDELTPQPSWSFDTLFSITRNKLSNCCYAHATTKVENGIEYCKYDLFEFFMGFSEDEFINGLEEGYIYVDFDARTGHNHGTKFRIRKNKLLSLYEKEVKLI
ncbi:MvaI/BcnI restriction endonuclease family protein [Alkalibacterium gilvum]|uniref:MvaI/BcnI restriction endonuclease family protein n=1 Tax=Alkalibacterium gilvum TaxID=1130080 RepID=A0A1H6VD80_9LACT|nr:MvaI/BcnI family restriction endonuclease [Alkalibacterium gilvum]SEJ00934.1 MvaI/BcnI restriction endonuclease family protein [Alkalibacterium gilvum]